MIDVRAAGVYLRGFCMGAADAVPGVSGGTIALITGIYDRLIAAITALDPRVLRHLLRAYDPDHRARAVAMLREMDVIFLVVLGVGVMSAVVTVARVVEAALHGYPALTFAFFFGLIAASAVALRTGTDLERPRSIGAGVAGFLAAFLVTGLPEAGLPSSLPVVFGAGMIAISAMVLPGISGSLLLLVLGQYDYMLGRLNAFVDALVGLADGGNVDALVAPAGPVVTFLAGAVVGLLTVAHVVDRALEADRATTITFLVGLMVGALRRPAEEVAAGVDAWTLPSATGVLVAAVVGAALVLVFDYYADVEY